MKNLIKKLQKTMTAATFAEAGEWDTAREMAPETELSKEATWLDNIFTAVTFAEAGLHKDAVSYLDTADETACVKELSREPTWLDKVFMAVTFAEAGLHNDAARFMKPAVAKKRVRATNLAEELGLKGVQFMYGTVSIN